MEKVGEKVGGMLNMSMLVWANSQARIEQKRAIRSVVLKRLRAPAISNIRTPPLTIRSQSYSNSKCRTIPSS